MLLFGYNKEYIFKERGFFKISENKKPSKITATWYSGASIKRGSTVRTLTLGANANKHTDVNVGTRTADIPQVLLHRSFTRPSKNSLYMM